MPFLIILGVIFAYLIVASMSFPYIKRHQAAACYNCARGERYTYRGETIRPGDKHEEVIFMSLAWPLTVPFVFAQRKEPSIVLGKAKIDEFWKNETAHALEQGIYR